MKKFLIHLFRRITGCEHKYQPYISLMDGGRRRVVWKCTRCGKEKLGD